MKGQKSPSSKSIFYVKNQSKSNQKIIWLNQAISGMTEILLFFHVFMGKSPKETVAL